MAGGKKEEDSTETNGLRGTNRNLPRFSAEEISEFFMRKEEQQEITSFLLQNNSASRRVFIEGEEGTGKSTLALKVAEQCAENSWICLVHILTYMIPFIFTSINPLGLLLIAVQHYIQDRTYMIAWFCRVTGKFQPEISKFWGHVIVDNVVHILWMAAVAYYCA